MKSISSYVQVGIERSGYGISKRFLRECLVKGRIKYSYLFCFGKNFFSYFYSKIIGRVMQRGKRKEFFYLVFYFFGNDCCGSKTFSSMHHPVPNYFNFGRLFYY